MDVDTYWILIDMSKADVDICARQDGTNVVYEEGAIKGGGE